MEQENVSEKTEEQKEGDQMKQESIEMIDRASFFILLTDEGEVYFNLNKAEQLGRLELAGLRLKTSLQHHFESQILHDHLRKNIDSMISLESKFIDDEMPNKDKH